MLPLRRRILPRGNRLLGTVPGSGARPTLPRASFTATDGLLYVLILGLGTLPFFLYEKAPGFINADVYYVDLADSLLHHHYYSANFVSERVQPPGLPVLIALICATLGCTHDALIRTMPVFLTLGFLLSYEVIRRQRGRPIAAASCLLLASSPDIFPWVTSRLWPSFPYFLLSMIVLLLIPKLETSQRGPRRLLAGLLLCFLLTAAVIVESAGIALISAMVAWLILSFFGDLEIARSRLKLFLPVVLFALLAEVLWLQRGSNPRDWPLPGRGESYLSQLRLKSGNYPELGLASTKDKVLRVENNLKESTVFLGQILLRRWISPSWASIGVAGCIILVVLGLWSSLWRSNSQLCALYFICYECIYLLWPWFSGVLRFALAVLPLACLYLAEGVWALRQWSRQYPRRVATLFLPLSILLAFFAGGEAWRAEAGRGLQEKISVIFWITSAFICARFMCRGPLPSSNRLSWGQGFLGKRYTVGGLSFHPVQLFVILAIAYLVTIGVAAEIRMGRENLISGSTKLENTPEIQAARWIQSHTDPNVVIASREVGLVYHWSRRRVIWFPPITNPKVLMQGIREHHINYVIVINRNFSYYLPQETICFDLLYSSYPEAFRLVEMRGQVRIYEVLQDSVVSVVERTN
jgi:hypothetical protein